MLPSSPNTSSVSVTDYVPILNPQQGQDHQSQKQQISDHRHRRCLPNMQERKLDRSLRGCIPQDCYQERRNGPNHMAIRLNPHPHSLSWGVSLLFSPLISVSVFVRTITGFMVVLSSDFLLFLYWLARERGGKTVPFFLHSISEVVKSRFSGVFLPPRSHPALEEQPYVLSQLLYLLSMYTTIKSLLFVRFFF